VIERFIDMIYECVMSNQPIYSQWQLTYDAISVRSDRRIFPFPLSELQRNENYFQPTHLNSEQRDIFEEMVKSLSLSQGQGQGAQGQGGQEMLLQEDFIQLLKLCQSNIGPYGQVYYQQHLHSNPTQQQPQPQSQHTQQLESRQGEVHTFDSVVFPKLWRMQSEDLFELFNEVMNQRMDGTREVHGVISKEKVMELIERYGREKESLLRNWTGGI
jgi:hypothetical protein